MLAAMLEAQIGMYHQWVCAQEPHSHWSKLPWYKVNLVSVVNLQVAHVDPSQ